MASSTLRKAIGNVKDQTSISLAKVSFGNMSKELKVAVIKATSHNDNVPPDEKYVLEMFAVTSRSPVYVTFCVDAVARRLGKTRDWVVAVKTLMLIHRLMNDGNPLFKEELFYATWKGSRVINVSDFRDTAHSCSLDQSAFVRNYSSYLDQRLTMLIYDRKGGKGHGTKYQQYKPDTGDDCGDSHHSKSEEGRNRRTPSRSGSRNRKEDRENVVPLRELKLERIFGKMRNMQKLLDRFIACRPTGLAMESRMVLIACYPILKESYELYAEICEVLTVLLEKFFDMEHQDCIKAFEMYVLAAKQVDELIRCYSWWNETGIIGKFESPKVERISSDVLDSLEEFIQNEGKRAEKKEEVSSARDEEAEVEEAAVSPDLNEIKALPAPEHNSEPHQEPKPQPKPEPKPTQPEFVGDLVDLSDDTFDTANAQANSLALVLFDGPASNNGNGSWEAFPQEQVTSVLQNPAVDPGKEDWETALVETASSLSNQKASLGGGFNPDLLNSMYAQALPRQQSNGIQLNRGSANGSAFPGNGVIQVLALPAPNGSMLTFNPDPFAASMTVLPPPYVQMAAMEKKHVVVQEQQVWQQYSNNPMQGQHSFSTIGGFSYVNTTSMPIAVPEMPSHSLCGVNQQTVYYYAPKY